MSRNIVARTAFFARPVGRAARVSIGLQREQSHARAEATYNAKAERRRKFKNWACGGDVVVFSNLPALKFVFAIDPRWRPPYFH